VAPNRDGLDRIWLTRPNWAIARHLESFGGEAERADVPPQPMSPRVDISPKNADKFNGRRSVFHPIPNT
jgi:hypothetical protein